MAEGKADSAPPYPHTPLPLPKAAPHDPMDVCLCVCTCMHVCVLVLFFTQYGCVLGFIFLYMHRSFLESQTL